MDMDSSTLNDPDAPVLAAHKLCGYYGDAQALHGISFAIRPGQITALLGRNGVGKTSTLRSILGLIPTAGRIELLGKDIATLPTYKRIQAGITYVPEEREIFSKLTVSENLELAIINPANRPRLSLVYDIFPDLKTRLSQVAGSLSGGQQQMVALARALLNPAPIMLIDEPTKGLAPAIIKRVVPALEEIGKSSTVVLVEQNLDVVGQLATDAIVLEDGEVAWLGKFESLISDDALLSGLLGVERGDLRLQELH